MVSSDKIEYAMYQTFIEKHPEWIIGIDKTLTELLNHNMTCQGIPATKYFSSGKPRETIAAADVYDLYVYVAETIIKIYNSMMLYSEENMYTNRLDYNGNLIIPKLEEMYPFYKELMFVVEQFMFCNNISALLQTNPDILKQCTSIIQENYKNAMNIEKQITVREGKSVRELNTVSYANIYGNGLTGLPLVPGRQDLFKKVKENFKRLNQVTNIEFNQQTINKCVMDIINGTQLKNSRNEYEISGKLYATQDVGLKRKVQQDSVLLLEHPQNKDFKIMIVADGMGGSGDGALSSGEITKHFAEWFKRVDIKYANNPAELQYLFNQEIQRISEIIFNKYNNTPTNGQPNTGATFTGAIICREQTIISHVGDSRAYTLKDDSLTLQTLDESLPWHREGFIEKGIVPGEALNDRMKFNKKNNAILRFVGQSRVGAPQTKIIPNESYDRLLIMSDGVSDLLTERDIRLISRTCPKELVTKELVKRALQYNAINPYFIGQYDLEHQVIDAGKDNATAAMYSRR